jgi:hypothetical protein
MDDLEIVGGVVRQLLPVGFHLGPNLIVPDHQAPFLRLRVDGKEGFGSFAQPGLIEIIFCVRPPVSRAKSRLRDAEQAQRIVTLLGVERNRKKLVLENGKSLFQALPVRVGGSRPSWYRALNRPRLSRVLSLEIRERRPKILTTEPVGCVEFRGLSGSRRLLIRLLAERTARTHGDNRRSAKCQTGIAQ